jgi:hypothetical protein
VCCLVGLSWVSLRAQTVSDSSGGARTLDSLLRSNSRMIRRDGDRFSGPGVAFMLSQISTVQFVAIGERHGIAEIPAFVGWLLDTLSSGYGFRYLALENGSATLRTLSKRALVHNRDSLRAYAREHPQALEFGDDEDLALYSHASALLEPKGGGLWFIDQEFGASHLLADLLASDRLRGPARELVDSLLHVSRADERLAIEDSRHWLALSAREESFARAARLTAVPVYKRVLTELATSARLFDLNRRSRAGELTGFASNDDRESLMKSNLISAYEQARRVAPLPKAVVKLGSAHLGRGQGPFGPFTVGQFLSDLATLNKLRSLHIMILAHNVDADSLTPNLWSWTALGPIAKIADPRGITLIDMSPLRPYAYSNRLGPIGADLRRLVYGYDAVLIIGGARFASSRARRGSSD